MGQARRRLVESKRQGEQAMKTAIPAEVLKGAGGLLMLIDMLHHALVKVPILHDAAHDQVHAMDLEYGDLTHAVELADFPRKDAHGILLKLKENRKIRREHKDFVSMAAPLKSFVLRNPQLLKEVENLHTAMHRLSGSLETRVYTMRTLASLEEAFNKAGMRTMGMLTEEMQQIADASDGAEGATEIESAMETVEAKGSGQE